MKYGRYEVVREIGKGSMGVVYQAHDPQIDRLVALKVLRQDRLTSEDFVRRFLKEAKAIGRLSHPNIVTVYDVGEDQGTVYLAMEFLEGAPMNKVVEERKLGPEEVVRLGIQVAETLEYAHKKGIVHRDVKPSNIIVQTDGQIKITDFGIAHIEDPSASVQTQAGEILGTPAYMSPEQVVSRPVDGRSDLFSLGIILYELSTGRRPFGGDSLASVFNAITQETPSPPSKVNPALSASLSQIIMKCLRKIPDERFESGMTLAEALKGILREKELGAGKAPTSEKKPRRAFYLALIVVALIAVGGLSYHLLTPKPKPPPFSGEVSKIPSVVDKRVEPSPITEEKGPSVPGGEKVSSATEEKPKPRALPEERVKPPPLVTKKVDSAPKIEKKPKASAIPEKAAALPPVQEKIKRTFLKVESAPDGAQVFVDGTFIGKAPIRTGLPVGKHEVRLTLPDYNDWEAQVQLREGIDTPLLIRLIPLVERKP
jgi:serine/threonine protein kinase